jgi:hypothetical protein
VPFTKIGMEPIVRDTAAASGTDPHCRHGALPLLVGRTPLRRFLTTSRASHFLFCLLGLWLLLRCWFGLCLLLCCRLSLLLLLRCRFGLLLLLRCWLSLLLFLRCRLGLLLLLRCRFGLLLLLRCWLSLLLFLRCRLGLLFVGMRPARRRELSVRELRAGLLHL